MKSLSKILLVGSILAGSFIPSNSDSSKSQPVDYIVKLQDFSTDKESIEDYVGQLKTNYGYDAFVRREIDFFESGREKGYATSIATKTVLSPEQLEKEIEKSIYHQSRCKAYSFEEIKEDGEVKSVARSLFNSYLSGDAKGFVDHFLNREVYVLRIKKIRKNAELELAEMFRERDSRVVPKCYIDDMWVVDPKELKRRIKEDGAKFKMEEGDKVIFSATEDKDMKYTDFCFSSWIIFRKVDNNWKVAAISG